MCEIALTQFDIVIDANPLIQIVVIEEKNEIN